MSEPDPADQKLGRVFWYAFWLLGLVVLTLLFGHREAIRQNPNASPESRSTAQFVEVNLKANRQGHYLSGGEINGAPVTFLLDTGATDVVVPMHLAKRLNLPQGRQQYAHTANGTIQVYASRIAELKLGPITLTDVSASLNPQNQGPILLGMSALKHLELRQYQNRLQLRQHL